MKIILRPRVFLLTMCLCEAMCLCEMAHADITVGGVSQASIGSGNQTPAGTSGSPQYSPNSGLLVFRSDAPNLITNDNNGVDDVFLLNVSKNSLSRLSVNSSAIEGDGASTNPTISAVDDDGLFATAFESDATNLGTLTDTNGVRDIYLNLPSRTIIEPISLGVTANASDGNSTNASIFSPPKMGSVLVAFQSNSTTLVNGDTNFVSDIFLATVTVPKSGGLALSDIALRRVSTSADGTTEGNGPSTNPVISGNGQSIVYVSSASNLVSGNFFTTNQIFLYDVTKHTTTLISKDTSGGEGDAPSQLPSISYNGRFIAYLTNASDIVSGVTGGNTAVLRYDTVTDTTVRVDLDSSGNAGDGSCNSAKISANGRFVTFSSDSSNLIPNDTNGLRDMFIKDLENGQIARVSVGPSATEANSTSDSAAIGGARYNVNTPNVSYRSFATNLTLLPTTNGGGDIFTNSLTLALRQIQNGTKLEVPPDVAVSRKKVDVSLEKFSTTSTATLAATTLAAVAEAASATTEVRYDVQIRSTKRKGQRVDTVSKKSKVTVRGLKAGTYTARYRARTIKKSTGKTVAKTGFTPRQTFTVS